MNVLGTTVDVVRRVWEDHEMDLYEIGPDSDGFNLVVLRWMDEGDLAQAMMSFSPARAKAVAYALLACADEMDARDLAEALSEKEAT